MIAETNIMYARLNTIEGEAMTIKEATKEMIQIDFSHVILDGK
jgi:hypothetical protein